MTHEDLAVTNILSGLSEDEQSRIRLACLKTGKTLAEYFALAVVAGTERILSAQERRKTAKHAATTTALAS